ncbi:hypothetical protein [Runella slithyformis]|uniref:Uncharacterized protein n=1 Tax=Runella slithyformis (strain ATCC 29530 / DSM 19594 / LMG 11500 / NCIMB 11436 / LSU 4) TaxID=761193 RepID=A0A7U3ZI62_RUNSL|nr:hypothetical protein [Runella slithyformis]AEI47645.1 hypothetical protein Runsl_1217 [Runella slithyformis DSM 19594]
MSKQTESDFPPVVADSLTDVVNTINDPSNGYGISILITQGNETRVYHHTNLNHDDTYKAFDSQLSALTKSAIRFLEYSANAELFVSGKIAEP